jgi:hypothetical protein
MPAAALSEFLLRFACQRSKTAGSCPHLAATTWIGTPLSSNAVACPALMS